MYIEEPVTLTTEDGVEIEAMHHYDDAAPLKTAITVMHPTTDVRGHFMMKWLVERGIGGFGFASRYSSRESELIFEDLLLDTAAGIEYLKSRGYQNVIGIGNSGGAEIVAGYQSQAVNPTIKSTPTGDPPDLTKAKLPPYDGLIFLNPHSGRALATTRGMDPSVGGEDGNDPFQYDPSLDLYNPENGPPYSQEFRDRYGEAQIERNHKITRWCQRKIEEMKELGNPNMTDSEFVVHRHYANLDYLDNERDPSARAPGVTIWGEDSKYSNYSPGPMRGPRTRLWIVTVKSWLSQRSLETTNFKVLDHIAHCKMPAVMICGTAEEGGPEHARQIYEAIPDTDKKRVYIEGGTHFMRGQDKQQAKTADAMAEWAKERGLF